MATSLWHRSGDTQLRKSVFEPANGASVQFFVGGTTTPLVVFNDADESTPAGSEVVADAQGRWPFLYVPTGNPYDYRILDVDGTLIGSGEDIPNPTINAAVTPDVGAYETGDTMFTLRAGTRTGWVRLNGRTLGSAASAATERANDDTSDLFEYLWNALDDTIAPVSGGRGGSAAADFAANKTIVLRSMRGKGPRGLDDMGNSAASQFANTPFDSGDATTPGSAAGANSETLAEANLPAHSHDSGTITADDDGAHGHEAGTLSAVAGGDVTPTLNDPGHQHLNNDYRTGKSVVGSGGSLTGVIGSDSLSGYNSNQSTTGITANPLDTHTHDVEGNTADAGLHGHSTSGSTGQTGSGTAINNVASDVLGTWYIKL